jgi:hypothetical protein
MKLKKVAHLRLQLRNLQKLQLGPYLKRASTLTLWTGRWFHFIVL